MSISATSGSTKHRTANFSVIAAACALAMGTANGHAAVKRDAVPSARAVLAQARAASGDSRWDSIKGLHAEGRIELSRLLGNWSRDEDLSDGRFAVRSNVGVFRIAEGFDGRVRWRQDPSGGIHPLNGAFSKRATATEAWLT